MGERFLFRLHFEFYFTLQSQVIALLQRSIIKLIPQNHIYFAPGKIYPFSTYAKIAFFAPDVLVVGIWNTSTLGGAIFPVLVILCCKL